MCGIGGIVGRSATSEQSAVDRALALSAALAHRGPDDVGHAMLRGVRGEPAGVLAHRRLAILDLSPAGHQPMTSADGRYTIVFNGEIYNFRVLRDALEREGAVFSSGSDTEVLLAGWARYGARFLPRLRGMFAFAMWDEERGALTVTRDPFGIKPLYYAERDGAFAFASETRALLATGICEPLLDPTAVAGYLAWGSVPEPLTMFRGIRSLPAGHHMEVRVSKGSADTQPAIRFADALRASDSSLVDRPEAAAELVREALRESVRHHLVSDVPVAVFLSGGIDSSAVAALAARESSTPLDGFTVVFEGADAIFSEAEHARAVARQYGFAHHEIPLSGRTMLSQLPAAFDAMDQPSMDGLNTYVVSGAVREAGIKVVLSGLGGDEMFAGYPSFKRARAMEMTRNIAGPLATFAHRVASRGANLRSQKLAQMLGAGDPARSAYQASRSLFAGRALEALTGGAVPDITGEPPAGLTLLQRASWYELTGYMRNTLLRDSDVFSMAHALELRVPFVDVGVARATTMVSDATKLGKGAKPLLVAAVRDLIPESIWNRPKQGFVLPFANWMHDELSGEVGGALTPGRLARVGLHAEAARDVWNGFRAGNISWSRPWALFTLVRWAELVGATMDEPRQLDDPALALV